MKRRIVEIANQYNITGMKRVMFYIIAPVVGSVCFVVGYVNGLIEGLKMD